MPIYRGVGQRVLPTINGNLLVALDALLDTCSVSDAARAMGVSQSTMSGTLARLRELFSDPILVRQGRRMVPTALALAIAADLRRGIDALETVLTARGAFDPKTSTRQFVIAANDRSEKTIVVPLVSRLRAVAPNASLQVLPWGLFEPPPGLMNGTVDLAIGIDGVMEGKPLFRSASRSIQRLSLYDSRLVTIARRDHPRIGKRLTLDRFCELDHVLATEQPHGEGVIDEVLATMDRARRIAVRVHRHALVAELVSTTDLIATIGQRPAARAAREFGLRRLKPPVGLPSAQFAMFWNTATDQDSACSWLRDQVAAAANRL